MNSCLTEEEMRVREDISRVFLPNFRDKVMDSLTRMVSEKPEAGEWERRDEKNRRDRVVKWD